jgi:hypothetical protein
MLSAAVAEYDIADARPCSGKAQHEPAARTVPRPMRSVRPRPTERRANQREGNRDHEPDDHPVRLRRRSDAGARRPDGDRGGGFERGGWTTPLFDTETATFLNQVYDGFLFGRRTYEIFAGSWGAMADPGDNPIGLALNTRPKYVASTTLHRTTGRELQVHGSRTLSGGCSTTTLSTNSTCSSSRLSWATARGCSPTPARTWRSSWSNRGPPPAG